MLGELGAEPVPQLGALQAAASTLVGVAGQELVYAESVFRVAQWYEGKKALRVRGLRG